MPTSIIPTFNTLAELETLYQNNPAAAVEAAYRAVDMAEEDAAIIAGEFLHSTGVYPRDGEDDLDVLDNNDPVVPMLHALCADVGEGLGALDQAASLALIHRTHRTT